MERITRIKSLATEIAPMPWARMPDMAAKTGSRGSPKPI
jgi:hypothetical protein